MREIGSDLPLPRSDLRRYWQQLAAIWVAVGVRRGVVGADIERIYTEREMRAADAKAPDATGVAIAGWSESARVKVADAAFAVRLPDGSDHYPSLTLVRPQGRFVMELLLGAPPERWTTDICAAYAEKPTVVRTIFLARSPAVGQPVLAAIEACGSGDRMAVQPFSYNYR